LKSAILIFVRPPEPGKVKTRLAAGIGAEKALQVYIFLLKHTARLVSSLGIPLFVFYAGDVVADDMFTGTQVTKLQQGEGDLGERMEAAFTEVFSRGFGQAVIIGSDCYELTSDIILEGLSLLQQTDLVIGPARDGGYYLLGMNQPVKSVFDAIAWSSQTVFRDTVARAARENCSVSLLPVLTDVDKAEDISFSYA
jgi:rSAM/selenodomain-associated transferase 1